MAHQLSENESTRILFHSVRKSEQADDRSTVSASDTCFMVFYRYEWIFLFIYFFDWQERHKQIVIGVFHYLSCLFTSVLG